MALVFPLMLVHERLADTLYITIPIWVYDNQIRLEPLGLVHLIFFAVILGIQVMTQSLSLRLPPVPVYPSVYFS